MRGSALVYAVFVLSTGLAVTLEAATITVDDSGGADYTTIKEALAAAASGDTVLVSDGTYTGANNRVMDFGGKNIVLVSENGAVSTIIDCENVSYAFEISAGVDSTAAIQGFTITNSNGNISGGGIWIDGSNPKILDCIITNCGGSSNGAGIELRNTPPILVSRCTLASNTAQYRGGGIYAGDSFVTVRDCLFHHNYVATTDLFYNYGGGGINVDAYPGMMVVRNCTFVGNSSANGLSGSAIHHTEGDVIIENCVFALGSGYSPVNGWCTVSHSVSFSNVGSEGDSLSCYHHDNLYVNPLFCDTANDDYTLCSNSPCLPGSPSNPWGELVGALDSGCGDCGSAVRPATWGRIKASYR